jgi:hypothetical protein
MIVSSHGIIGSSILQFDPDAAAFFARVTAAGGTLSATEKSAVNQLVLDMKDDGIWTPMKAIYPMVGASAAACAQNLKSSSFTGTFTATGWTFASTGVTGNGTSAYMDTNVNASTNLTFNSIHLSFYSRTNSNTGAKTEIGAIDNTITFLPLVALQIKRTESLVQNRFVSLAYSFTAADTLNTENLDSKGYYLLTRTASNSFKHFKNSIQQGTTRTTNSQTTAPNRNLYIGASNRAGTGGDYSDRECAFASIGDGLTDTEASDFYTAVQAFQTTLSRNV